MSNIADKEKGSLLDTLVITGSIISIALGLFVYIFFQDQLSTTLRIGVFVGCVAFAILVFFLSPVGKRTIQFGYGSFLEMKRVVWPTKDETVKMTGIVIAFSLAMALFLWLVDMILNWLIYGVFLGWN